MTVVLSGGFRDTMNRPMLSFNDSLSKVEATPSGLVHPGDVCCQRPVGHAAEGRRSLLSLGEREVLMQRHADTELETIGKKRKVYLHAAA